MAVELSPKGINVNSIAPGVFPSEMTEKVVGNKKSEQVQKAIPAKRCVCCQRNEMSLRKGTEVSHKVFRSEDSNDWIHCPRVWPIRFLPLYRKCDK